MWMKHSQSKQMDTWRSFATSKTDLILIFITVVVAVFVLLYSPDPCTASCSSSELWTNSTWGSTTICPVRKNSRCLHMLVYKFFYLHYRFWVPSVTEEQNLYMSSIVTWRFSGRVHRSPRTPSRICPQSACGQPEKIFFYLQGVPKKSC